MINSEHAMDIIRYLLREDRDPLVVVEMKAIMSGDIVPDREHPPLSDRKDDE